MIEGDRDLHEAFQAARRMERAGAPPFRRAREGRVDRRRTFGPAGGVLLLAGAAALLLLMVRLIRFEQSTSEHELARRVMAWRSTTDFLLPADAPGLLSFVPAIGKAPAGSPLQALDPGNVLGPPILTRSPRT